MNRLAMVAVLVGLTMPVFAQQQMPPPASPTQATALKNNVHTFELALKTAVISAGGKVAQWATQLVPNLSFMFADEPRVRSVPLIDNSLVFHVEVAEITSIYQRLFIAQRGLIPPQPQGRSGAGVVDAAGVAPPDPMGPVSPKAVGPPPDTSPDKYYTDLVHEALIDTILDSSGVLPLRAGQTLTVACNPVDVAVTNPLDKNPSRQLILTIKGEDLLALKQGTLSREEAKQRIVERRF